MGWFPGCRELLRENVHFTFLLIISQGWGCLCRAHDTCSLRVALRESHHLMDICLCPMLREQEHARTRRLIDKNLIMYASSG